MLLLDAGDALLGDRGPAVQSQGKTSVQALNLLKYDAVVIGEGDLRLGLESLRQRIEEAAVPLLSANIWLKGSGERLATPYVICQVQAHRIGVIGLTGSNWDPRDPTFALRDPVESVQGILPEVAAQSDVVIILSHATLDAERQIADHIPGVHLIVSGGAERLDSPEVGSAGALIVHADRSTAGHAGLRLGIARLSFDAQNRLLDYTWEALSLGPEVGDDPEVAAWLDSLQD